MNEIINRMMTQYDMVLLMILLSLLIKIYKYYSSSDTHHTFKSFFLTVRKDLVSDLIVILCLWIIDVWVISIPPSVMLIGITLSDSILNWVISNEHKVTNRLMNKILELIIDELNRKKESLTESESEEDEQIPTE